MTATADALLLARLLFAANMSTDEDKPQRC